MPWWGWLLACWGLILAAIAIFGSLATRSGFFMDETRGTAPRPPARVDRRPRVYRTNEDRPAGVDCPRLRPSGVMPGPEPEPGRDPAEASLPRWDNGDQGTQSDQPR